LLHAKRRFPDCSEQDCNNMPIPRLSDSPKRLCILRHHDAIEIGIIIIIPSPEQISKTI